MRKRGRRVERWVLGALVAASMAAAPAGRAAEAGPGWALRRLPAPGVVQGDVVVTPAGVVVVGQGSFGPGAQSIVRLDASGATVIAAGFGSLGGFALDAGGTLYVVDNCFAGDFGCDGATTGDTLYAIPDALTRTGAIDAADAEVLPAGAIPAAFDVIADPALGVLVSDAAGPGAGRVLRVADGAATPLLGGFDFTAGLAVQTGRLLVGNSDASFVGSIQIFQNGLPPGAPLATGLSGVFDLEADAARVFVSGGFTGDFSSSTVVALDGAGEPAEIATGFAFTGGLAWDAARRQLAVLDFGAEEIALLCEDADADGACDAACPGPTAARVAAEIALAGDGAAPAATLGARWRVPRGTRADPSETGVAVVATDADGTVLADWRVPAGAGWERRRRRWTWRGAATDPVTEVRVRRRGRRLDVVATGRLLRAPGGAFAVSAGLGDAGGTCGRGSVEVLAGVGR